MQSNRDFAELLVANHQRLLAFIRARVQCPADVADIAQDTCIQLWQERDRFEPGTNFGAWACTVARYAILSFNSRASAERLRYSNPPLELVESRVDEPDDRLELLSKCLPRLRPDYQILLHLRYEVGWSLMRLANHTGRSRNATYLVLSRARRALRSQIERLEYRLQA